jgi:hypothetical protein
LHGHVDRFVDAYIFRRRHLAEQRLAQAAAGLPHAESYEAIAQMMVREPVEAFGLRSAAFFRQRDGEFCCEAAHHANALENLMIGNDDPLVLHVQGAREQVSLAAIGWHAPGGDDPGHPIVAFPIFIRHELRAIALYGGHATGEAIDPDELRMLRSLCSGAAAALDHSATIELTHRLDEALRALGASGSAAS